MADCAEKVQHLQRCSPYTIPQPRVVCIIVWQPWVIKSTTLTALFPIHNTSTQGSLHYRLATLGYQKYNAYSVEKYVLIYYLWHDSLKYH